MVAELRVRARAERLSALAEKGNATAAYELAILHKSGAATAEPLMAPWKDRFIAVPGALDLGEPNPEEALRLFRLAAASGHSGAMYEIALSIENSDPVRAAQLYEQAGSLAGC